MADLKDYSGKFSPELKYDDFSKDFLSRLLVCYARCYIMADALWYTSVQEKFDSEVADEMDSDMWINRFPVSEVREMAKVLDLRGDTVADAMKFFQLAPMFPQGMFERDIEIINDKHAVITIRDCPTLRRFERKEPQRIVPICQVMEPASASAYARQLNPGIVVTMPIMPPRKDPHDICCQFEFKLNTTL
ncbi:DUF6125 family protein [Chloroflexota bacterium]